MTIRTVATLVALMLLTACKSDVQVSGDVFVATRGGQAFKLALVNVNAYTDSEIRKAAAVQAQQAKAYFPRGSALDSLIAKAAAAGERLSVLADAPGSQANLAVWTQKYTIPEYPGVGDKARWNAWRMAYYDSLAVMTPMRLAQARADSLFGVISEAFPAPAATGKTDADGRFVLTLERGKRYALHAMATREVFNTTETYEWLIWVTPSKDGARVILANDNMIYTSAGRETKFEIKHWMQLEMKMR